MIFFKEFKKNHNFSYHIIYCKNIFFQDSKRMLQLIVNSYFMKSVSVKIMITLSYFLYN